MRIANMNNLASIEYPAKLYLTSAKHDLRLSAGPDGLFTTRNRQNWEVWSLLKDPDCPRAVVLQSVEHKVFLYCDEPGEHIGTSQTGGKIRKNSWELRRPHHGDEDVDGVHVHLCSCASRQLLSCNADGTLATQCSDQGGADTVWKLELLTGELCFLSNPTCDKRLRMNSYGTINLTHNWKDWEVWRFMTLGRGKYLVANSTFDGVFLASNHKGQVFSTRDRGDLDCRWTVAKSKSDSNRVTIESTTHRRFLCAADQGNNLCTSDRADHGNTWNVKSSNRSVFYITSCDSHRILCSNPYGKVYSTENRKPWEQWKILPIEGGCWGEFNIVSCSHGRYLGSTSSGHLRTLSCPGCQEVWEIKKDRVEGVVITCSEYGTELACFDDGDVFTMMRSSHTWTLEANGFDCVAMLGSTTKVTTVGDPENAVQLEDLFSPLLTM